MSSHYSYLFVPATKAADFLKKLQAPSSALPLPYAIIFDLEDSIREHFKASARDLLSQAISEHFDACRNRFRWLIRINDCSSTFFSQDLIWLRSLANNQIGIKLPKCRGLNDMMAAKVVHSPTAPMIPTIETLEGYENREAIMAYANEIGVQQIGFGAGDMTLELGVDRDYALPVVQHVICNLIITAKRHGLDLIDSVSRVLPGEGREWQAPIAEEARFARANGFAGKKAIHPAQVPIIEEVFNAQRELDRARKLLVDFDDRNPTRAVRSSETGDYVGTPSLKRAERTLLAHVDVGT